MNIHNIFMEPMPTKEYKILTDNAIQSIIEKVLYFANGKLNTTILADSCTIDENKSSTYSALNFIHISIPELRNILKLHPDNLLVQNTIVMKIVLHELSHLDQYRLAYYGNRSDLENANEVNTLLFILQNKNELIKILPPLKISFVLNDISEDTLLRLHSLYKRLDEKTARIQLANFFETSLSSSMDAFITKDTPIQDAYRIAADIAEKEGVFND